MSDMPQGFNSIAVFDRPGLNKNGLLKQVFCYLGRDEKYICTFCHRVEAKPVHMLS